MNIALPILLLAFGGLTFWVLNESKLKWYFRAACITTFCLFTIVFWSSIHTFLGWPALENDIPDKALIHWVIIKEPNKITKDDGGFFVLLESANEPGPSFLARFFGYRTKGVEPRLYGLEYNRGLHEQFEKELLPSLRKGQPVLGRLTKGKEGEGRKGKKGDDKSKGKGDGSESQEQVWEFHRLRPSDFLEKPEK